MRQTSWWSPRCDSHGAPSLPTPCISNHSPSLSFVSTTPVLPCKLHRIACRDVSQLSTPFSSSPLRGRVIERPRKKQTAIPVSLSRAARIAEIHPSSASFQLAAVVTCAASEKSPSRSETKASRLIRSSRSLRTRWCRRATHDA